MLYCIKMSFWGYLPILLLFGLFSCTSVQGQNNGIPTKFNSFRDYYSMTSKPDSLEKFVYAHRNNPRQFLNELLWLELSRYTTSDRFGRDMETIRNLLVEQKSALGTAVYHTIKSRSLRPTNIAKAAAHLKKAAFYFNQSNDTSGIIYTECEYTMIALSLELPNQGNYKLARSHFTRAANLIEASSYAGDKLELLKIIERKNKFVGSSEEEIRKDFRRLLQTVKANPQFSGKLASLYGHYAKYLSRISKHQEALKYALMSLSHASNISEYRKILYYTYVGEEYIYLEDYKNAEVFFLKAIAANDTRRNNLNKSIVLSYDALIHINLQLRRFDSLQELIFRRDSIQSACINQSEWSKLMELQAKYESEKKELKIQALALQSQIAQSEKQYLFLGLLVTSLLVGIAGFLLVKLRNTNVELLNLQNGRDKFYTIVAHDLRSPMNNLNDLGSLLPRLLKEGTAQEIEAVSNQIEKAAKKTTLLLDNLVEWGKNNYFSNQIVEIKQKTDVVPLLQELYNLLQPFAEIKKVTLEAVLPVSQDLLITPQNFRIAVRNLLDNALKNTPEGGNVFIEMSKTDEPNPRYFLSITDTGKGIAPDKLFYLQQVFSGKIKPEVGRNGLGLGMVLLYEYVKQSKVVVQIESKMGKGTCFRLIWPASDLASDTDTRFISKEEGSINQYLSEMQH